MTMSSRRKDEETIEQVTRAEISLRDDHHEQLFQIFKRITAELAECAANDDKSERPLRLEEAQTTIMRTAATLPARSIRDLVFKLGLWRLDSPELDRPTNEMTRANAVAYSTFRDLARLLNDTSVLTEFDKAN